MNKLNELKEQLATNPRTLFPKNITVSTILFDNCTPVVTIKKICYVIPDR